MPETVTAPRQVLPGSSYLVTRRCFQRHYLLKPSKTTNDTFLYVLAVAAQRYEIQVHAFCVLSNHFHLVLTDPKARLPAFQQFLDALVARALNASLGRSETFWAPDTYSAVTLVAPADVVGKIAYVLTNPVAAGLVRTARDWPGLWSAPERIGGAAIEVRRPKHFFDPKGSLPETVSLQLTVPPRFASAAEFRGELDTALTALEAEAVKLHREFLGVSRVLAQKPTGRPKRGEPRRGLNPRIAARDKWKRAEAIHGLLEFVASYKEAWAKRRDGDTTFVFPAGTYLLRILHGVPCVGFG